MPSINLAPALPTLAVDSARSLSPSLVAELNAFCDRLEDADDPTAAVLHLTGTETARNWPGDAGDVGIDLVSRWEKALRRLERTRAVKIAVAEGCCGGPALEVLLTADHRIGAPDVRVEVPVSNGTVWAGMSVHRLTNQLGAARARQLLLFGAQLTAERALAIGLLDESAEDPHAVAADRAAAFGRLAPDELAIRRRLILDACSTGFDEALGMHLAACDRTLRRADPSDAPTAAPVPAGAQERGRS
jgi:isomerase DpgB